jgi:hypothetical protein
MYVQRMKRRGEREWEGEEVGWRECSIREWKVRGGARVRGEEGERGQE